MLLQHRQKIYSNRADLRVGWRRLERVARTRPCRKRSLIRKVSKTWAVYHDMSFRVLLRLEPSPGWCCVSISCTKLNARPVVLKSNQEALNAHGNDLTLRMKWDGTMGTLS